MKHGSEKSDARVVAAKSANKSEKSEAESMEPRRATKENMDQTPKSRTQCREIEVSGLERVRQRSKSQPKERMTTLMHHLTVAALWSAYDRLKRNAAPGVDGVTWQEYGEDLIARLTELHQRLQSNRYRPQPSRRVYIAKADLRQRPLGIAALEDKNRPRRGGGRAQCNLRAGVQGLLARLPAWAKPASSTRRAGLRHPLPASELDH